MRAAHSPKRKAPPFSPFSMMVACHIQCFLSWDILLLLWVFFRTPAWRYNGLCQTCLCVDWHVESIAVIYNTYYAFTCMNHSSITEINSKLDPAALSGASLSSVCKCFVEKHCAYVCHGDWCVIFFFFFVFALLLLPPCLRRGKNILQI